MILREELETPRSLGEMRSLLDDFHTDRVSYPDPAVHKRAGIAKTLIEEYAPLYELAKLLDAESAALTRSSHPGPDASIHRADGAEITVQITMAGEDHSSALQRALMASGEAIFPSRPAHRLPSRQIETSGRALTTRQANTDLAIAEVEDALRKKRVAYRAGTQVLLVSLGRSPLTMVPDWRARICAALASDAIAPYDAVYVSVGEHCFLAAGPAS